jgi:hypothetical protein
VSPSTDTLDVRFDELLALFVFELDAVAVAGPVEMLPMDADPPVADAPAVAPARAAARALFRLRFRLLFKFEMWLLLVLLFWPKLTLGECPTGGRFGGAFQSSGTG